MKTKNIRRNKYAIIKLFYIVGGYIVVTTLLKAGLINRQYTNILVDIGINIMLAVSLNLITGFLGELTLGHAGFMSIGAYTGALITMNMNLAPAIEFSIAILAGGIMAAFFGFLIGVPVLRLRGDYLAIVTLAYGEIIKSILNALKITNGSKGLTSIPKYSTYENYTLIYVLMVITILVITNLVHSRDGRAIRSIRDNDIAAQSIGIKISRYKVLTFVVSAFFAGIAGVLYAHNVGGIRPTTFDYNESIEILVIVVLGGMGNISGSVIAAIVLTVLPEYLRGAESYRMLLYAIVLILMMLLNASNIKAGLMSNKTISKLFNKKKAGE